MAFRSTLIGRQIQYDDEIKQNPFQLIVFKWIGEALELYTKLYAESERQIIDDIIWIVAPFMSTFNRDLFVSQSIAQSSLCEATVSSASREIIRIFLKT